MQIDAKGMYYRELNDIIRKAVADGEKEFILDNINGQRFIGTGLDKKVNITINGVPGNDLASFMDGPTITVNANGQDAIANTMNAGKIVIHGHAGDVLGYAMRGGKLFIKGNVGYRVGIHMKEYKKQVPLLVVGGKAGNFFGEYMAGGTLVLLGMNLESNECIAGDYLGTGMHGGKIYIRGEVCADNIGKECRIFETDEFDMEFLRKNLAEYCEDIGYDLEEVMSKRFIKLLPVSSRPYGQLYVY